MDLVGGYNERYDEQSREARPTEFLLKIAIILQQEVMQRLYRTNIWDNFVPSAPPDPQGWNGDHPSLRRLAQVPGRKLVADVGVWKGQSTINLALAIKQAGIDGCVVSIDTFLGSSENWNQELFKRRHGLPDLYETFLSNVHKAGVTDIVIPMAQTSVTAAQILKSAGLTISLVHVDAAHEYEEVRRDAEEYFALLEPNGFMIGDDYHFTWPGVVKAANEFAAKHVLPLTIEPPKWIVQKPNGGF